MKIYYQKEMPCPICGKKYLIPEKQTIPGFMKRKGSIAGDVKKTFYHIKMSRKCS